jgi:hypothetical protein
LPPARQQGRDLGKRHEAVAVAFQLRQHRVEKFRRDLQMRIRRKRRGLVRANVVQGEDRAASTRAAHQSRSPQKVGDL